MKKYIIFAVAAITLLAGCQKDNTTIRFKANIEEWNSDGPKMYMGSGHQCWSSGDALWANGQSGVTIQGSNSSSYYFEMNENAGGYQVGYPLDLCTGTMTTGTPAAPTKSFNVTFATDQAYSENNGNQVLEYSPMVGYAHDVNAEYIDFYNVGSLLAVNITNNSGSDFLLGQITAFSYNGNINGSYSVRMNNDGTISTVKRTDGGTNMVSLKFSYDSRQTISNGQTRTFYIAMAPNDKAKIAVAAYAGTISSGGFMDSFDVLGAPTSPTQTGSYVAFKMSDRNNPFNLQAGKIYNINLEIK